MVVALALELGGPRSSASVKLEDHLSWAGLAFEEALGEDDFVLEP